ncbi:MAG TPA: biopolymer transporter ExbD [Anaeromyxobacter sp.]|nr:biopolymer transporter ExbD [Anaeromyxobacter sp.]
MSMDIGSKSVRSDINVTPLVDVVLVLLIIFMVITPLLQRGKPVVLPQARELSALKSGGDPIMVSVTRDGKIWVDKSEVEKDAIAEALTAQMALHAGSPVLVKGDKDTDYKYIRELIFEISKTHLMGVSLAGTKIKEKE